MAELPLTQQAHDALDVVILPGDTVIDATVGNGHDTLFLARQVQSHGKVYGFDIQQAALDSCHQRLLENQAQRQVSLFHAGHECMPILIPVELHQGGIKAAMFNLGYLPGADHAISTRTSTTLSALDFTMQALSVGGMISILAYTGHSGGNDECTAVKHYLSSLDKILFRTTVLRPENTNKPPPELIIIRKQVD